MLSVTSLSGGKTSAYMAVHYPTDYYVFACVLTSQQNVSPKDKGLYRECVNRIPHFVASRELDSTLKAVLDLEQLLGKEIKWVSSELTYDDLIKEKQALPNRTVRFCTQELKIKPIFNYCYFHLWNNEPVLMNVGFRSDENDRVVRMNNCKNLTMKYPYKCMWPERQYRKQRKTTVEWRVLDFPLWRNGIPKETVVNYWKNKNIVFPSVSNCDFCFFHKSSEHLEQLKDNVDRALWWVNMEERTGNTFTKNKAFSEILKGNVKVNESFTCGCTD